MKCPKHADERLINNLNTGIEYEYGIALALMTKVQSAEFLERVVKNHPYKDTIISIGEATEPGLAHLIDEIDCEDHYVSLAATQDDKLGCSDVLICCSREIKFGISVKFSNTNNWNPSSRNFIDNNSIYELKKQYQDKYLPEYITDMRSKFGSCRTIEGTKNTWSRKRSSVTDNFIDLIRDKVIDNWDKKTAKDKENIIGSGFQVYSPLDYYVVNIKQDLSFTLSKPYEANHFSIDDIVLKKHKTSFVSFEIDGKIIVKLQVKFNNGFIEKTSKKSSSTFMIDEILFKKGDPFGSWNFNV
jgi:hypothetical protein